MVIKFSLRDKGEKEPTSPLYPTVFPHGTLLCTDFSKHPGCWMWEQTFVNYICTLTL